MQYPVPPAIRQLPAKSKVPTSLISADCFDLDAILPLSLIRQHTKTDDVPHVTDEQLELYRKAAIEAAELYTGMLLQGQRIVHEQVRQPSTTRLRFQRSYTHTLDFASADGIVYLYGVGQGQDRQLSVRPGSRELKIPIDLCSIDLSSCCNPCGSDGAPGLRIMYKAGFANIDHIPSGILVGCLKYIAWSIENPGDVLATVKNSGAVSTSGLVGTNDAAWASGAIEQWRMYVRDAI